MSVAILFRVVSKGGMPILIVLKIAYGSIAAYSCERILRRPTIFSLDIDRILL